MTAARSSIGAAYAVADAAPANARPMIRQVASDAFLSGFARGAIVTSGVALVGSFVALAFLPARSTATDQANVSDVSSTTLATTAASSTMNTGSRHDFFTVIHKGQRKELFAATILAGTTNWEDTTAANDFVALWTKVTSMLEAHAAHEHKHFFPLLDQHAPEIVAQVEAAHEDLEHDLITLTDMIAVAASKRSPEHGLAVYRRVSAFVANYLLHILDEETIVMPAIWQHCTDAEINVARLAFQADQSPAGVVRSRRAILTSITHAELVTTALGVQRGSTEEVFNAFMADARQLLEPSAWNRLYESVSDNTRSE